MNQPSQRGRRHFGLFVAAAVICAAAPHGHALAAAGLIQRPAKMHQTTEWRAQPSFKFDTLCFLNVLSGDPFYLNYYRDESAKFEPKLTPAARGALASLKRKIKDEGKNIISAFLCLYFSVTDDQSLDDVLRTLDRSAEMQSRLKRTAYYSDQSWGLFESVKEDLKTVFRFLKSIQFEAYWRENVLPRVRQKIADIERELPKYNVIAEVETHLGTRLASHRITVFVLYYSQPHGIRVTGTRFLTDVAWPLGIVLRNAVHEMMHPPFDLRRDRELRESMAVLKQDAFLMDKVLNHNPAFGYNSFEGFVEEDSVQALEQVITEKMKLGRKAQQRWRESDDGMHVLAVVLYSLMKEEGYNRRSETFRDFLIRMGKSGRLAPGKIKAGYDGFYSAINDRR